jgi:transglutaminase-like putative cysteine protease
MCRAAGIPARYLHGQCYFSSGVIGHVIPEIYVDGKWWICDPSNNSATFGTPTWKGMETFNGRYNELEF